MFLNQSINCAAYEELNSLLNEAFCTGKQYHSLGTCPREGETEDEDSGEELSVAFSGGGPSALHSLHSEELSADSHAPHYFIPPPATITTILK